MSSALIHIDNIYAIILAAELDKGLGAFCFHYNYRINGRFTSQENSTDTTLREIFTAKFALLQFAHCLHNREHYLMMSDSPIRVLYINNICGHQEFYNNELAKQTCQIDSDCNIWLYITFIPTLEYHKLC